MKLLVNIDHMKFFIYFHDSKKKKRKSIEKGLLEFNLILQTAHYRSGQFLAIGNKADAKKFVDQNKLKLKNLVCWELVS